MTFVELVGGIFQVALGFFMLIGLMAAICDGDIAIGSIIWAVCIPLDAVVWRLEGWPLW